MSRHKTYSLSPRDCLKTCLFQKWQRMVAPPGRQTDTASRETLAHTHTQTHTKKTHTLRAAPVSFPAFPPLPAEPSRQAPNKRRKRKMSGGSTISGGGGTNNNNNNKKKSPSTGFPLSSQVPVSTTLLSSVGILNYMLSEQDSGQIVSQKPNHARAMHAITDAHCQLKKRQLCSNQSIGFYLRRANSHPLAFQNTVTFQRE